MYHHYHRSVEVLNIGKTIPTKLKYPRYISNTSRYHIPKIVVMSIEHIKYNKLGRFLLT